MSKASILTGNGDYTDQLVELLQSPDATKRCGGRYVATGVLDTINAWLAAEVARGTDSTLIVHVLTSAQMQEIANFTAQAFTADADEPLAAIIGKIYADKFVEHVARCRSTFAEIRSAGQRGETG